LRYCIYANPSLFPTLGSSRIYCAAEAVPRAVPAAARSRSAAPRAWPQSLQPWGPRGRCATPGGRRRQGFGFKKGYFGTAELLLCVGQCGCSHTTRTPIKTVLCVSAAAWFFRCRFPRSRDGLGPCAPCPPPCPCPASAGALATGEAPAVSCRWDRGPGVVLRTEVAGWSSGRGSQSGPQDGYPGVVLRTGVLGWSSGQGCWSSAETGAGRGDEVRYGGPPAALGSAGGTPELGAEGCPSSQPPALSGTTWRTVGCCVASRRSPWKRSVLELVSVGRSGRRQTNGPMSSPPGRAFPAGGSDAELLGADAERRRVGVPWTLAWARSCVLLPWLAAGCWRELCWGGMWVLPVPGASPMAPPPAPSPGMAVPGAPRAGQAGPPLPAPLPRPGC